MSANTIKTTVQADVGPGDRTGVYYITICNIPFATTWKELKDWLRSVCAVDHIEIFGDSTSGWVRVHGRENFERAWSLLNGGLFNGRVLIASDKNRTESIKIKEPVEASQVGNSQTPHCQATATPPAQYGLPTSTDPSPRYSTASGSQYSLSGYNQEDAASQAGQSALAHNFSHQKQTYAAVDTSVAGYAPHCYSDGAQFALPYRVRPEAQVNYQVYGSSAPSPPEYVATEQRKLHVSPFPQQARPDEVTAWIRRKVGSCRIVTVDIPKNQNSKYLRGHAYVVFESAAGAIAARDLLAKARFQGRRVTPRLTVEGVSSQEPHIYETYSSTRSTMSEPGIPAGPSRNRSDDRGWGERSRHRKRGESKGKGHASVDSKKKRPSSGKKPSSYNKKNSHSDKKSSTSKKRPETEGSSKDPGPVIVDGTSHRQDKR